MHMGIAMVGCGYAADFYMAHLPNHPQLNLVGVYDRNDGRLKAFCAKHSVRPFDSLANLINDAGVELIVNLTNPSEHYPVTLAALEAGRHVYTEKPFALNLEEGRRLVDEARRKGVQMASAPCSLLGDHAQTVWAALRKGAVGRPLLAMVELHEGMIHKMLHERWVSASGAVWPHRDEFQTGCVLEHGGYILTWLTAFFGGIVDLTASSQVMAPEKSAGANLGPDFSCAILKFAGGTTARITFSVIAPADHRLIIVGEEGVLEVEDIWDFDSPVYIRRGVMPDAANPSNYLGPRTVYPVSRGPERKFRYHDSHNIDWMRGVAELADAARAGERSRLSGDRALHILEATLAISDARGRESYHRIETPFESVEPMTWAR
jgi:predicted dehydrogenase